MTAAPSLNPAPAPPHPAAGAPALFGGEPLFPEPLPMVCPTLPPPEALLGDYRRLFETGQLTNGKTVARFEQAAAQYLGVDHCVAVSSCTSGLILVEKCLGLRGEVIVPSFTFFATAHSLLWNSLDPVLVDCDPSSWNLDPERVRRAIRPATSAILAVHVFGNPAAARELEAIARRAGVRLLFDAAHAFGARLGGTPVGAFGDAEVFSLTPTKPLVAAEGGLIATRDAGLAGALRAARNYGHNGDYDCRVLGLNARMTELEAALALASLPLVEPHMERRERLAQLYSHYLGDEPGLGLQRIRPQDRSSRKDFSIVVDGARFGVSRDLLASALEMENVPLRRYFDPPLHRQRLYRRYYRRRRDALETTERISRGVLNLPIYSQMSEDDVARIAGRILHIRDWVTSRDRATPGAGRIALGSGCQTARWAAG